jgi:molybdenum cofactor biosynthesis protein MoaC
VAPTSKMLSAPLQYLSVQSVLQASKMIWPQRRSFHGSAGKRKNDSHVSGLSHVSKSNQPTMVDVADKRVTKRTATASTTIILPPNVAKLLVSTDDNESSSHSQLELHSAKGPVIATAIVAGTMAVKQTSNMIPFCHPLPVEGCKIHVRSATVYHSPVTKVSAESASIPIKVPALIVECTVKVTHKTGVEMEALAGASATALTIYDMCKALSHDIIIAETRLISKSGGKSDYSHK